MKSIFYAYLTIIFVVSGCSSGKSTFERGNYYEAVITSVNRLRKNNDHKKSVETLRQAYPMAVAFYEDRAKTSLASAERFKWTEVVRSYTYINTMYDEIKRCPGALAVIPDPVNYFSKLQEARKNAAEEHYAAGILALQLKTREGAKHAYGEFKIANEYVAGYKEVNDYLRAALDAATVKIVVEPIPVHSKSAGVSAEFFNDKISEFVHAAPISEFVKFYSRAEAKKLKLSPDHIVQLQFDDFTVGEVYKHEKEIHLTKDSVVMASYVTPSATASKAQSQDNNSNTGDDKKSTFVASGPAVVATSSGGNNTQQNGGSQEQNNANETAEKRRLEQQETERALAEKLKAEREAAEKERVAREAAEKALAEKESAERQRLEKEEAEKELAERSRIEREQTAQQQAENERLAKEAEAKAEREQAEKMKAEKEKADREQAEKERLAKEAADKEKAAKEKADRERSEKEKAEKEKAEKEKAEKEKTSALKYIDPTINAEDTMNLTDAVTVCHIPPGNQMNGRTLKINRAALKAHLAHGDIEGSCDSDKQGGKPADEPKGKPAGNPKSKPDNKSKASGGAAKTDRDHKTFLWLSNESPILVASAGNDPETSLRYFEFGAANDTTKIYGTVKATFYHYTKTTTSKGIISFRIVDAKTGALLSTAKMPGEFVWRSEWATFNGDERALTAEQLKLSRQKELPAPAAQELFIEFTRPIYDQITTKLKDFYKGY